MTKVDKLFFCCFLSRNFPKEHSSICFLCFYRVIETLLEIRGIFDAFELVSIGACSCSISRSSKLPLLSTFVHSSIERWCIYNLAVFWREWKWTVLWEVEENCGLRGIISEHIFAPNGAYYVYYSSKIFWNTRRFENRGYHSYKLHF